MWVHLGLALIQRLKDERILRSVLWLFLRATVGLPFVILLREGKRNTKTISPVYWPSMWASADHLEILDCRVGRSCQRHADMEKERSFPFCQEGRRIGAHMQVKIRFYQYSFLVQLLQSIPPRIATTNECHKHAGNGRDKSILTWADRTEDRRTQCVAWF